MHWQNWASLSSVESGSRPLPLLINNRFQEFYLELYISKAQNKKSNISNKHSCLSDCSLKDLEMEECEALGYNISHEEIAKAISCLMSGKTLGSDEVPVQIYKWHVVIVAELLVNMLSDIHSWQLCTALNMCTRSLDSICFESFLWLPIS